MQVSIARESNTIEGHVLDVARAPLLAALRRYDPQLYLKWSPKKRAGRGCWQLRREPELKAVKIGYYLDTPKGKVNVPGDVFEVEGGILVRPRHYDTNENGVKDFEVLDYRILDWLSAQDLWKYGYKGKDFGKTTDYREAKFEEKVDEEAAAEKEYMIKQHRTQFNDFREYILAGGDPYRLMDYWDKV